MNTSMTADVIRWNRFSRAGRGSVAVRCEQKSRGFDRYTACVTLKNVVGIGVLKHFCREAEGHRYGQRLLEYFTSSEPHMPDTSSTPACSSASLHPDSLLDRYERVIDALRPVRSYLQLLSDCAGANADDPTDLKPESVAVAMDYLAERLKEADDRCAALAKLACEEAPEDALSPDLEQQGNAIDTVRHLLLVMPGLMGSRHGEWPRFDGQALGCVMRHLAEQVGEVEERLHGLVFGRSE